MSKRRDDKYVFEKPAENADDEPYSLAGPADFAAYIKRVNSGEASEQEKHEFCLRVIKEFCDCVYRDERPPAWVMTYLADQFYKVIHGGRWEDEFRLPWTKVSLPCTRAEWQSLGIFCDVENARRATPRKLVGKILAEVAADWAVSYETARDSYYKHRKRFLKTKTKI